MSSWGFITDSRIEVEANVSGVSRNKFCMGYKGDFKYSTHPVLNLFWGTTSDDLERPG